MMEKKELTKYRQPVAVEIALKTRDVIASSPEMEFLLNDYEEEEW